MEKQILKINKKFFSLLESNKGKKILRIYGYNSPDDFIKNIIKKLNNRYEFLNISEYDFLNSGEEKEYHQYNGYIQGKFLDYDLITVSFTTIHGKEGNVFLYQQIMPMITSKLKKTKGKKFLIDDRIKKICILTTHKSTRFTPEANEITDTGISNIQMSVKYINTIGFDVINFIRIKNLSVESRYNSVDELIDHANYLQKKKTDNSQFKQVYKERDTYYARFEKRPKGQEVKFFALKLYAAIVLLKGQNIDISHALEQTNDMTLRVMKGFINFLEGEKLKNYSIFRRTDQYDDSDLEIVEVLEEEREQESDEKTLPCYKKKPIFSYNTKGKRVFKTRRVIKKESFEIHGYKCACHDKKHQYFIADATKKPYIEGHHMIPMEFQEEYWSDKKRNLDCAINVIPLCTHCHNKIHKAIKDERIMIINTIFKEHEEQLKTINKELSFGKFAELYNVYIY